ncbi:MAG: BrnT family toxin [Anaerolineae bacterium]|nr:BrnT family toxin [Anaerolineae bacterium]MCB0241048.1 BrnT family toxin [Anaerolineae bacterium]MCB9131623.1 BrnT family toxin [Anaerolineales bacterium]MCB9143306.1 BrnT family toxin [Anaerolineales bacterium]HRX04421.1 BrnT family toxin [Anaerolineae bacterium]
MSLRFQWNAQKAVRNERKHRVTFAEAATVFRDPLAEIFDDEEHSEEEYREIIIGRSDRLRLIVVSFTERGDVIRIISARKADREECEDYENANR